MDTGGSACTPAVSKHKALQGSPIEELLLETTQMALGIGYLECRYFLMFHLFALSL